MSGSGWIVFFWAVFAFTHMFLSERRASLIGAMGGQLYAVFYSGVAFASFVPLVWIYTANPHSGPLLWAAPSWLQMLGMVLSILGIAMVPAAVLKSSPVGMIPRKPEARGLIRITRHPLFMGIGLWGLGHCMINGFLTDALFFGGFTVFAIVGCAHQDSRKRREDGERFQAFFAETSLLPFAAILTGRGRLVLSELPWLLLGVGVALALLLYYLHPLMFG